MTLEEIKKHLVTFVALGDSLSVFIPGEWDDLIVDFLRALSESDPLLQFIVDQLPQPTFGSPAHTVTLTAADGTVHSLDPATIILFVQIASAIIKIIRERRRS